MKPGYKQTEVGVIPEEWEAATIGEVFNITAGGDVDPKRSQSYQDERHPHPIYSNALTNRGLYGYCSYADHPTDSITVTARGMVGAANFRDHAYTAIGRVLVLQPHKEIAGIYFSEVINNRVNFANESTGVPQLTAPQISKYQLPVPPLPEQRAIATALSDVDGLLGAVDRLIAKKRDLKQASMQQLLTGQTRLPGFNGEWVVKTFGEVFDYLPTATNSRSDLDDTGDTYYIHYGDIHTRFHNHLDFRTTQPPRIDRSLCRNAALLKNGDWVMADASEDYDGVGKTVEIQGLEANINAISGLHTFVLREKTPTFAPGFKGHLGNMKSLHEQYLRVATGMKVYGVSKTALKDLELPVPPLPEQTAIASVLSEMDAELAGLEQRREKTRALKQGMMQELLTGRTRLL